MAHQTERTIQVVFAGNPNVGKSTLFNRLTGLRQHTGNWPGKTVGCARGQLRWGNTQFLLTDLPGTYALDGQSEDEQIASAYIRGGEADCWVVVCDGCCLERSLILALKILQQRDRVVICINLMDEAQRQGISIDCSALEDALGAPVVPTAAGNGVGVEQLLQQVKKTALQPPPLKRPVWPDPITAAETIAKHCVHRTVKQEVKYRLQLDRLMVSRRFGKGLLWLLLLCIICLTVWGANYPSMLLQRVFGFGYTVLIRWMARFPWWLRGILADGIYATTARVLAVMVPPMAIFFPLFTLLEDIGYLPRAAFLLDPCMARCGCCGKQALTMCMGLGCNAVGVMGCRILDCPKRRLAAILTNTMIPCNGRFPALILLGSLFFPGIGGGLAVAGCVVLGMAGATVISGLLLKTCLHGEDSTFIMELPPFRRPRIGQILVRSVLDRTLVIAGRALCVAAPAGAVLWVAANTPLLGWGAKILEPLGRLLGMNGVILLAFLAALPANELLIPTILLALNSSGSLSAAEAIGTGLLQTTMTGHTAICTMIFILFHWPCATTLTTIYRETGSIKNTVAAFLLPTAVGCILCSFLNLLFHI